MLSCTLNFSCSACTSSAEYSLTGRYRPLVPFKNRSSKFNTFTTSRTMGFRVSVSPLNRHKRRNRLKMEAPNWCSMRALKCACIWLRWGRSWVAPAFFFSLARFGVRCRVPECAASLQTHRPLRTCPHPPIRLKSECSEGGVVVHSSLKRFAALHNEPSVRGCAH